MNTEIIEKMRSLRWASGNHTANSGRACIAEAAAWATGAPWSDTPPCWPREISLLAQRIHDAASPRVYASIWTDERLLGMFAAEHGIEATRRRACQAAEYARMTYVARYPESAAAKCAPIVDRETASVASDVLREDDYASDADAASDAAAAYAADAASDAAASDADAASDAATYAATTASGASAAARQRARIEILDLWIGGVQ